MDADADQQPLPGSSPRILSQEEGAGPEGRPRFFRRLRERMGRTRGFIRRMDALLLGKRQIDPELLEELEELLVTSDVGVKAVTEIFDQIRDEVKRRELSDPAVLRDRIRERILGFLQIPTPPLSWLPAPFVLLVVGVNGVGKTTTIAKLAHHLVREGRSVLLVAADTFRAAAGEQLEAWGKRIGCPVVRHQEGADPSSVAFDGVDAGIRRGADVIIVDTAGRLHTKVNLMEELKKIRRVIGKKLPGAPNEVFLVLDATTGQNALAQARLFKEAADVTGIVLTKLDGTAKGGIVVSIARELSIPIRYIGVGEAMEDLRSFDPEEFVDALFAKDDCAAKT
ncbi:MAG: signal recognition particle-docking protein FtsY [Deltaproteobacteria bacterium]